MAGFTGVFPVSEQTFKIGTKGLKSVAADYAPIAQLEEISLKVDGKVENWNSIDAGGWGSALLTAKSLKLSGKCKRSIGDKGNDYIAGLALKIGGDCYVPIEWSFPDGSKLALTGVFNISNWLGGKSTDVAPLEFDVDSHGQPVYTPAP